MDKRGIFRGVHTLTLDNKGRIAMPSCYRESLYIGENASLVITIDPTDPCLWLCPMNNWEIIETKVQALPSFHPEARRIQRLLIGHAMELEMDNQGRMLVPSVLRDYAQLKKSLILMGQGKRFELWDAEVLDTQRKEWLVDTSNSAELPPEIRELVL